MKIRKIIGISLLVLLSSNICFASTGIVNTPAVRIREKASTDSKIVTKAYEDDEIEILGEEGDWYKVKFDGKEGYASKSLIKEKSSSSAKNETSSNTATNTSSGTSSPNTTNSTNTSSNNTVNTNTSNEANTSVSNTTATNTVSSNETTTPEQNAAGVSGEANTINGDAALKVMPNFASNEIRLLIKDTKVEVLRELNNWCEISANGTSGWVLKNKINSEAVVPNESTPEPEPEPEEKPAENTVSAENTVATNTSTNTAKNETNSNTANTNTASSSNSNTVETNTSATNTTASTSTSSDASKGKKGKINVETANVRSKASKSSAIVNCLDIGDEVTITAEEGEWYKITSSKVESGYVLKSLITLSNVSSRSDVREDVVESAKEASNTSKGAEVVEFAKQYLGYDYVLGGKTPESGFDCSGYTRYVYKNFGYSLGTVAAEQDSVGKEVAREDLIEGDLILFYNEEKTKIGHTGIYMGDNTFIHAANTTRGVVTDNLKTNSYYSERFVTARRIVE